MNIENIRTLAAHLRKPETAEHFAMQHWLCLADDDPLSAHMGSQPVWSVIARCGCVACIAGHAAILAYPSQEYNVWKVWDTAQTWLGLTDSQAAMLFTPPRREIVWSKITPLVAARVLTLLALSDEVCWPQEVYRTEEDESDD